MEARPGHRTSAYQRSLFVLLVARVLLVAIVSL